MHLTIPVIVLFGLELSSINQMNLPLHQNWLLVARVLQLPFARLGQRIQFQYLGLVFKENWRIF